MTSFGALAGVRVLDFTHMIAGPYITLLMAYHGAEIIKVESHSRLDGFRRRRGDETTDTSRPFGDFNRNKRDVTLNLKTAEGRDLARRIAAVSDVVTENFSVPVMRQLGLSYNDLREVKSDIIMLSSQGMGQSGPYRDFVAWGPSVLAFGGYTALWNHPDQDVPVGSQTAHPDYIVGLQGLVAAIAALHYREQTGNGQYIEIAQTEAGAALLGPAFLDAVVNHRDPVPQGNARLDAVPHGAYQCAGDDAWCVIAVRTDTEWAALCSIIGHAEWSTDDRFGTLLGRLRHRVMLDTAVEAWTRERSPREVEQTLQAAGVPAAVVASGRDLVEDPHLQARGFLVDVDHPFMGHRTYAGIPTRMSETPAQIWRHAPLLGQDNDYVFGELLGLTETERRRLEEDGVIS